MSQLQAGEHYSANMFWYEKKYKTASTLFIENLSTINFQTQNKVK